MGQRKETPVFIEVNNNNWTEVCIPATQKLSEFIPVFRLVCKMHGKKPVIGNRNTMNWARIQAESYARQN